VRTAGDRILRKSGLRRKHARNEVKGAPWVGDAVAIRPIEESSRLTAAVRVRERASPNCLHMVGLGSAEACSVCRLLAY
jgi:hypothetical protein